MSDARVAREKDIIIEELKMYDDSPDTRLNRGLLELLYPRHPIRFDIGGTAESVHVTTRTLLELCHAKYYHPSNMMLVLAGDIEPQRMIVALEKTISRYPTRPTPTLPSLFAASSVHKGKKYAKIHLPIAFPMMGMGFNFLRLSLKIPRMNGIVQRLYTRYYLICYSREVDHIMIKWSQGNYNSFMVLGPWGWCWISGPFC